MNEIVLIKKSGYFYNCYNDNAVIIHYLLKYKMVPGKRKVGFPVSSLERVKQVLNYYKINYAVEDKGIIIESKDFKKVNKYAFVLKDALREVQIEDRFILIENEIRNLSDKDTLRILEVLEYEVRK